MFCHFNYKLCRVFPSVLLMNERFIKCVTITTKQIAIFIMLVTLTKIKFKFFMDKISYKFMILTHFIQ